MPFLRDTWYAAGFSEELVQKPISRRICNERVVLFRDAQGAACILQDRCPHRFVPLSMGKIEDGGIRCGYHGLLFDKTGTCIESPNEDGVLRREICVRAYPTVERYGTIWIWMGDPEAADPAIIPDFSYITAEGYASVFGCTHINANYEMITDNLLDLSHVHYLHLASGASPGSDFKAFENQVKQDGNTVWSMLWQNNYEPQPFLRHLWGSDSPRADGQGHVRWDPPALLVGQRAITEVECPMEEGVQTPSTHFLTPETEHSTHYFWAISRTSRLDDTQLDVQLRELGGKIFATEDGPMIAAQQEAMGEATDFLTQNPVILKADAAGVRARLILKNLIRAERTENDGRGDLPGSADRSRTGVESAHGTRDRL